MRTVALWVLLAVSVVLGATATEHAGEAGVGADVAVMTETEALTSASSLSQSQTETETQTAEGAGVGGSFDPHKLYKPGDPGRGPCCRICPNIFYAVPRITPRPQPSGPPRLTTRQQRTARFAAIFDRAEPKSYASDDFSFIAMAEQHSVRSHSRSHTRAGAGVGAQTPGGKMDKYRGQPKYPEWPEHEYTADPYQDQPIPEFTPYASLPGINCCNICPAPGIGQLKWPDFLKWGEKPAVDDYPEPQWDLPCCKLCSAGCYSNGEKRPPGVPDLSADPPASTQAPKLSLAETNAAVRNGKPVSLAETETNTHGKTQTQTQTQTQRGSRAIQMRGNWPKQMDPPGANKPLVPKEKSCTPMLGCCQVCYNHPMIFDHAPEGIW